MTAAGKTPQAWLHVRVVGIDKADSAELRPLSSAAAMYRIGLSAMLAKLREWINTWCPEEVVGGISGKNVNWIYQQFAQDVLRTKAQQGDLLGVKLDLSKAFDRARYQDANEILRGLGAPERLVTILEAVPYNPLTLPTT